MFDVAEMLTMGCVGVTIEVSFNAILSYCLGQRTKASMKGEISMWMFFVYAIGLTIGFDLIEATIPDLYTRWVSYPFWIWGIELLIGLPCSWCSIKIWDYKRIPMNLHWKGIISFLHFPFWIAFGILIEYIRL